METSRHEHRPLALDATKDVWPVRLAGQTWTLPMPRACSHRSPAPLTTRDKIMEICGDWQAPGRYLCPAQVVTAHQLNIPLGTNMENCGQYDWRAPGPWHTKNTYNSSHPAAELRSLRATHMDKQRILPTAPRHGTGLYIAPTDKGSQLRPLGLL